jgi:transposase InsO family protein
MRERHIVGVTRRRRRSLTKQDTSAVPAPDLIGRDFTAPAPGHRLVGDITHLPTREGWLYLATTIDLFNREVVGHAMATHAGAWSSRRPSSTPIAGRKPVEFRTKLKTQRRVQRLALLGFRRLHRRRSGLRNVLRLGAGTAVSPADTTPYR